MDFFLFHDFYLKKRKKKKKKDEIWSLNQNLNHTFPPVRAVLASKLPLSLYNQTTV